MGIMSQSNSTSRDNMMSAVNEAQSIIEPEKTTQTTKKLSQKTDVLRNLKHGIMEEIAEIKISPSKNSQIKTTKKVGNNFNQGSQSDDNVANQPQTFQDVEFDYELQEISSHEMNKQVSGTISQLSSTRKR